MPCAFHVETTWKRLFPRRFNVKYTWFVWRVTSSKLSKKAYEVMLFDKVYFESFPNTLYIEMKYKRSKIVLGTISILEKMHPFFSWELQVITVLYLIWDSYMSWSRILVSPKVHGEFSIFNSISFLLKFTFLFNKQHRLFDF